VNTINTGIKILNMKDTQTKRTATSSMAPLLSKAIKVMDLFAVRASKAGRILDSP